VEKDKLSRKLAVILHADIVGSTVLVQRDERLAHERMRDVFRRFSETITTYGGKVHEVRGDALLAEFERASDAVSATLAFQSQNRAANENYSDDIRPELRVGIALGEVIIADNTITGAGVVLAQRLEQLSEPNGLCISSAIREALPARLPFQYGPLGEQKIKGFEEPVRVFFVALGLEGAIPAPEAGLATGSVATRPRGPARGRPFLLLTLAAVVIAALAAGGFFAGLIPLDNKLEAPLRSKSDSPSLGKSENLFDGRWQVSVDSLTGCLNNAPRAFTVTVTKGSINEPNYKFPKTGQVSEEGEFRIESRDATGKLMNTQTGKITDGVGEGRFEGRKPSCNGDVKMVRLEG
jgi:class 3 adenylate cyclase